MCGILGIVTPKGSLDSSVVQKALQTLHHRGPDASGLETIDVGDLWQLFLGHTRLSIIDLSEQGRQPLSGLNNGHRVWMSYNGELYNYQSLKHELSSDWSFYSNTDTEVMLAGMATQGQDFLQKVNGMYAFAFYSEKDQTLILVRDRLGKKPLYYYVSEKLFIFASELKPLTMLVSNLEINESAYAYFRWLGYIPGQMSIYKDCYKLKPSGLLKLRINDSSLNMSPITSYWDPFRTLAKPFQGNYDEAKEELSWLIDDATQKRLQADVPIGLFLSGGIDSSLVATSLAKLQTNKVKLYTVQFNDPNFDESSVAQQTSQMLGLEINVLNINDELFRKQIDKLAYHYDEPFSDSSQIPTMAIAQAASQSIKVVLTGDGGDEPFLGYPRFGFPEQLNNLRLWIKAIPFAKWLIHVVLNHPLGHQLIRQLLRLRKAPEINIDSKIDRLMGVLDANNIFAVYDAILSTTQRHHLSAELNALLPQHSLKETVQQWYPEYSWSHLKEASWPTQFAALDLLVYLVDDVLVKVDRATMAYSLEARSPLLDYRIVEFALSLPESFKHQGNIWKKILRDLLNDRIPHGNLASLPKRGFGVPLPDHLPPAHNKIEAWNRYVFSLWSKQYEKNLANIPNAVLKDIEATFSLREK